MQHAAISRTRYVQENRKMRFQEAHDGWSQGRLTQAEVALLLGQCERSFGRHIERFKAQPTAQVVFRAAYHQRRRHRGDRQAYRH